jgi:hypothetical protein
MLQHVEADPARRFGPIAIECLYRRPDRIERGDKRCVQFFSSRRERYAPARSIDASSPLSEWLSAEALTPSSTPARRKLRCFASATK